MNSLWYAVINLVFVYACYPLTDTYLYLTYEKYKDYNDKRKNYIIKNFIKSKILKYLTYSSIPLIPVILFDMQDCSDSVHFLGSLYVASDTISLTKNMKLSFSTKMHHMVTTVLGFFNFFIHWENTNDISKLLAIYCILSCYSYSVNECLSLRFLQEDSISKKNKRKAFLIYAFCCLINWLIHISYFILKLKNMDFSMFIYYSLISLIAYDDVVLLKWLRD